MDIYGKIRELIERVAALEAHVAKCSTPPAEGVDIAPKKPRKPAA